MGNNILKSFMVILFLSVVILSPILPTTSDATRFTVEYNTDVVAKPPICPTCLCCEPPPPGLCCECCTSPSVPASVETTNGSP
ncbi:hypothetical protein AAHA92_27045 [Salvia divinorum]|uniref:Transmembrane protein n=1 Tax=Salvia divinorum TaxID=28513 RepID=A0ABD1G550_SALDI